MNNIQDIANEIKSNFKVEVTILDKYNIGVHDSKYIIKINDRDKLEQRIVKIIDFIIGMDNVYSVDYKLGGEYLYEIEIILEQ